MSEDNKPEGPERIAPRQIRISYEAARGAELRSALDGIAGRSWGNFAKIAWHEHDVRELPAEEATRWFNLFLETDRKQKVGGRAAAMRCSSLLFSDDHAELIWSFHPALIQNGHAKQILDEVARIYGRELKTSELLPPNETTNGQVTALVVNANNGQSGNSLGQVAAALNSTSEDNQLAEIERQLTEIWKIVIGRSGIGRDEDFFEAGGHSLSAARLVAHIEKRMGVEVPLAALLEFPTISYQSVLIRDARKALASRKGKSTEPAAQSATQIPFFFLGGDATFRPLVKRISAQRRVHSLGLQPSVLAELGSNPALEQIAFDFVREVQRREPSGPVMLGGWCAHGLLALEVARQVKDAGRDVAHVVLLEVSNPSALRAFSPWWRFVSRQQLKLHLLGFERMYLSQLSPESAREYVRGRVNRKMHKFRKLLGQTNGHDKDHGRTLEILYRAAERYTPQPYDGRVLLLRSTERTMGFASDERLGWGELLGIHLEVQRVPGNHYSIYMPPNADALAKIMHETMLRTEAALAGDVPLNAARLPSQAESRTIPLQAE